MKVLIGIIMFIVSVMYSQDSSEIKKELGKGFGGIKGGIAYSSLSEVFLEDSKAETVQRLTLGIFGEKHLNDIASFQWEIIFSSKGEKNVYEESETGSNYVYHMKMEMELFLNYFELPLILKIHIPNSSFITPYAYFGLSGGVKIKSEIEDDFEYYKFTDYGSSTVTITADDSGSQTLDNINSFESCILFGAGIKFPVKDMFIFFDVRMNKGLTNFIDEPDYVFYNESLVLTTGIEFR